MSRDPRLLVTSHIMSHQHSEWAGHGWTFYDVFKCFEHGDGEKKFIVTYCEAARRYKSHDLEVARRRHVKLWALQAKFLMPSGIEGIVANPNSKGSEDIRSS